jgi:hypothetical protein
MALIWVDGFEGYESSYGVDMRTALEIRGYTHAGGGGTRYFLKPGRFGNYALRLFHDGDPYIKTPPLTTDRTLIIGASIYFVRTSTGSQTLFGFYDGDGSLGMNVRINPDPGAGTKFQIRRGANILETIDNPLLPCINQWFQLEFKVYCDNTAGTYELRLNGETIASDTGIDTQEGSSNYHAAVGLHSVSHGPVFDDFYVCDGTGSKNNDFLGIVKAVPIFPSAEHTIEWETMVGGSDHADAVAEQEPDDDTSYIEDDDAGDKDIFEYGDITDSLVSIDGLMLHTLCRETDATTFDIIQIVRSGGTEYDQASQLVGSSSFVNRYDLLESDPDTGIDWTKTGINSAQFGVKVD